MKLLVLGHARHGKDTVCEMLREKQGLKFVSSSMFVCERAVIPYLAERGITYGSTAEAYEDRGNHRADWHNAIAEYNSADPARLGRELFSEYDIYCGLRSMLEFSAMYSARLFDATLWVYRPQLALESKDSMKLTPNLADVHIHNDGSLEELSSQVDWAWEKLCRKTGYFKLGEVPPWNERRCRPL
jgi:hypothetical protein